MAQNSGFSPVRFDSFQLAGGLDLVTPSQSLRPGIARDSLNFEVSITGGYTRIAGYERFDGRIAPSDAVLLGLQLSVAVALAVGTVITTAGGASATVVAVDGVNLYYTAVTSVFSVGNTVLVGGSPIGTVVGLGARAAGQQAAVFQAAASDYYRSLIGPVPGSGAVRGVAALNGALYAWRDSADGLSLGMYKSSPTGWQQVSWGRELPFSTSTAQIGDGVVVTGGTSGATALVTRAVLDTGVWASGGAGRLIVTNVTGTFSAGEALKVGGAPKATATAPPTAISYAPGGFVQSVVANFGGAQANKLYGADGKNRAFEFDGTSFVPIKTGMAADTPVNVTVHKNYLFLTFANSVQFSALANPYQWTAVLGAGEIVVDSAVTALQILPGDQSTGALAIFTASNTFILYGSGQSTFQLVPYNVGVGAMLGCVDNLEDVYQLSDRGIVNLTTSKNYGNFDSDTLTLPVRPFIQAHRGRATTSALNREKSQFRVFYSDGYGLYTTIQNGKCMGSMPVYFPNPVLCWAEWPATSTSAEFSFFGSSNGYVYKLDAGANCDGAAMDFSLRLNFNATGNARVLKRYRKAALEVNGTGFASFSVGYQLAYADAVAHDSPQQSGYTTALAQPFWDSFVWDNFYWDGQSLAPVEIEMTGSAENVALQVFGSSAVILPFTINTTTLHYTPRRSLR